MKKSHKEWVGMKFEKWLFGSSIYHNDRDDSTNLDDSSLNTFAQGCTYEAKNANFIKQ